MRFRDRLKLLVSQALNSIFFGGDADESLSARAWRERGKPEWRPRRMFIDDWCGDGHCKRAYLNQQARAAKRQIAQF